LPWAIHGKETAKSNHSCKLYGNLLDLQVRNTQDQQTLGLPVGPDTSFILAELIGAKIDEYLLAEIGELSGCRYVDDFHLYFDTRADAEMTAALMPGLHALLRKDFVRNRYESGVGHGSG
jgi:hypothetical protein